VCVCLRQIRCHSILPACPDTFSSSFYVLLSVTDLIDAICDVAALMEKDAASVERPSGFLDRLHVVCFSVILIVQFFVVFDSLITDLVCALGQWVLVVIVLYKYWKMNRLATLVMFRNVDGCILYL
jgi:hypothetical protein